MKKVMHEDACVLSTAAVAVTKASKFVWALVWLTKGLIILTQHIQELAALFSL